MLSWALLERRSTGRVTLIGVDTGTIAGLATITPAAGYVGPMPALGIGAAAGLVCFAATRCATRGRHLDGAVFGGADLLPWRVAVIAVTVALTLARRAATARPRLRRRTVAIRD